MKRQLKYWIKERDNPQVGTYYVPCGQLSKAAAKRKESAFYGTNWMHSFDTEAAYEARIVELRKKGESVQ